MLTLIAPWVNIQFLGSSLTFMMVRTHSMYTCDPPSIGMMRVLAQGHEQGMHLLRTFVSRHFLWFQTPSVSHGTQIRY